MGLRYAAAATRTEPPASLHRLRLWRFRWLVLRGMVTRQSLSVRLRHEFNLWAEHRRGERMEQSHRFLTERVMEEMDLAPGDRILDLGCGEGWASRLLAARLGKGCGVVGLDISDEMIRRARAKSVHQANVKFVCASSEEIPWPAGFFTKALCVESFYYFESQERVLRELFRVMSPGGGLFLLVCLYKDYARSPELIGKLRVPVRLRAAAEYIALLESQGWVKVRARELARPSDGREPDLHDRGLLVAAEKPRT